MGQQLALQDDLRKTLAPRRWGSVLAPLRVVSMQWRHGQLLLVMVALGMLVAVGIASAVPVYVNLAPDAQLQAALVRAPAETNVEVTAITPTIDANSARALDSQMGSLGGVKGITAFAPTAMSYVELQDPMPMVLVNGVRPAKASPSLERAYSRILSYDLRDALPHMRLISGSLPRDDNTLAMPDVLVTPQAGLKVGDIITVATRDFSARWSYRVSGVWFPRDERDPYWNGRSFRVPEYTVDVGPRGGPPPPVFPLLVAPAGFYASLGPLQPSPGMIVHHVFLTQPTLLNPRNAPAAIAELQQFRTEMAFSITGGNTVISLFTTRVSLSTRLDAIIQDVERQFVLLELPLNVVVSQVLGLTLLFILVIAALLVERHAGEIAVLKSRGASSAQVVLGFLVQGVLLGALAAVAGPLIAVAVNVFLVRQTATGASGLSVSYLAEAADPASTTRPAIAVAALCLVAMVAPAALAMRRDVLAFRQEAARSARAPLWRRYYLDLAVALIAVAGYVELGQFGGFGVRSQLATTGSGASVVMLIAPGLLLLAGALVMLRCLPLVARAGMSLAARTRGPVGMLSFAQIARGSGTYTLLMLLLTLTVSLSLFALTFQSSLGRNAADRAAYVTGGDKRVTIAQQIEGTGLLLQAGQGFTRLPGVTAVTPLVRGRGSIAPNFGTLDAQVLGIDPATFAQAAYWRDDYAAVPLATLLSAMRQHAGAQGAGQPNTPIWALVSPGLADALHLQVGTRFTLTPQISVATTLEYVVGAIVNNFPTLYEGNGSDYIVVDGTDLLAGMEGIGQSAVLNGPNEYWLRTTGSPRAEAALASALGDSSLFVDSVTDRRALTHKFADDPLSAGMIGLLIGGAALCGLLAVLGSLVQAATSARRRVVQFAVLRTLGVAHQELTRILLGEQLIVYLFGLGGGTLIGLVLASATLPYLTFDSAVADPGTAGVPPPVLAFSIPALLLFYAALVLAFLLALGWQRLSATYGGLGKLLRLGED